MKSQLYFFAAGYLRFFASIVLFRWRPKIIAVTGSAGKSTTLYLTSKILNEKFKGQVYVSKRANSAIGIPLNILGITIRDYSILYILFSFIKAPFYALYYLILSRPQTMYVVELDVDRPNEMLFFTKLIKPEVVIWLSSLATHTAPFKKLISNSIYKTEVEAVADEFSRLIRENNFNIKYCIYNADSKLISRHIINKNSFKKIAVSINKGKYSLRLWRIGTRKTHFSLYLPNDKIDISINSFVPRVFAYTLLCAYAVADIYNIQRSTLKKAIAEFRLPAGRSTVLEGINNTCIIDSSYNASKEPVLSMLEVLFKAPGRRKVAVLGDMRELGNQAKAEHESVAGVIVKYNINQVILVGPLMTKFAAPILKENGYSEDRLHIFSNSYQAGLFLKERLLNPYDTILVKASQNTLFFEVIVELILANQEDRTKLCRRGKFWEAKRKEIRQAFYKELDLS